MREWKEMANNCMNCKYFKGTFEDGKTKCGNSEQWNTWIKPWVGCEMWKKGDDNHGNP